MDSNSSTSLSLLELLISQMLQKNFNHLDAIVVAPFPRQVPRLPGPTQHSSPQAVSLAAGLQEGRGAGAQVLDIHLELIKDLQRTWGPGSHILRDLALSELIYRVSSPTDSL